MSWQRITGLLLLAALILPFSLIGASQTLIWLSARIEPQHEPEIESPINPHNRQTVNANSEPARPVPQVRSPAPGTRK